MGSLQVVACLIPRGWFTQPLSVIPLGTHGLPSHQPLQAVQPYGCYEVVIPCILRVFKPNYLSASPWYEIDVLDFIPDEFVEDAFDLIWGLKIEGHRHEIPGRLFHELMPERIRKLLAAFYTRSIAVHLTTANLAAMNPEVTIEMTQIVEGDSLRIAPKQIVKPGIRHLQLTLSTTEAYKMSGEKEEIELRRVKAVLMNP